MQLLLFTLATTAATHFAASPVSKFSAKITNQDIKKQDNTRPLVSVPSQIISRILKSRAAKKVSIEETTSGPPGQTTHHVMSGRDPVFSTDMVANNIITFANSPPPAAVPTYDGFPRVSLKSALNFEDEESSSFPSPSPYHQPSGPHSPLGLLNSARGSFENGMPINQAIPDDFSDLYNLMPEDVRLRQNTVKASVKSTKFGASRVKMVQDLSPYSEETMGMIKAAGLDQNFSPEQLKSIVTFSRFLAEKSKSTEKERSDQDADKLEEALKSVYEEKIHDLTDGLQRTEATIKDLSAAVESKEKSLYDSIREIQQVVDAMSEPISNAIEDLRTKVHFLNIENDDLRSLLENRTEEMRENAGNVEILGRDVDNISEHVYNLPDFGRLLLDFEAMKQSIAANYDELTNSDAEAFKKIESIIDGTATDESGAPVARSLSMNNLPLDQFAPKKDVGRLKQAMIQFSRMKDMNNNKTNQRFGNINNKINALVNAKEAELTSTKNALRTANEQIATMYKLIDDLNKKVDSKFTATKETEMQIGGILSDVYQYLAEPTANKKSGWCLQATEIK